MSHYRWTYDVPHDYKKYMSLHIVQFLKARMKSGFLQDEETNIKLFSFISIQIFKTDMGGVLSTTQ